MTASRPTRADAPWPTDMTSLRFAVERVQDRRQVDVLIDRAFGPGRFAKTAERLREGVEAAPGLSVCAWSGAVLAGAVRLWPTRIGDHRAVFLGPIAVEPAFQRRGLGADLVRQACARARNAGENRMILVGDLNFFGPLGFDMAPPERVFPPGPVDPRRLLWTALTTGALDGVVGPLRTPLSA